MKCVRTAVGYVLVLLVGVVVGYLIRGGRDVVQTLAPRFVVERAELPPREVFSPPPELRWIERLVYRDVPADTQIQYVERVRVDSIWGGWPLGIVRLTSEHGQVWCATLAGDSTGAEWFFSSVGERWEVWTDTGGVGLRTKRRFPLRPGLRFGLSSDVSAFAEASLRYKRVYGFARAETDGTKVVGLGVQFGG
jgi:hypothetical protein